MTDAHAFIKENWTAVTRSAHANVDTGLFSGLQPEKDLDIAMPDLDATLAAIAARGRSTARADFVPGEEYPTFPPAEIPTALNASGDFKFFRIAALEAWIEQHLESWLLNHLHLEDCCEQLRNLIELYHSAASTAYVGVPVSLSIMYVALLELWVACDKSACLLYPLLRQYDPEVNLDEFQCLILPLKSQMTRLARIERYVQSRRDVANARPSVFRDFGHSSSFAVKYFDQSVELQDLLAQIKRDAAIKQQQKRDELAQLKQKHKTFMEYYNSKPCETHEVVYNRRFGYTRTDHKPGCKRCAAKDSADALSIDIYEWPVSSNEHEAKATVFELQIPQGFSHWRDVSMFLIATVLGYRKQKPEKPRAQYTLDQHYGLGHMLSWQYHRRRIVPLSEIKPHTVTHRRNRTAIPNVQNDDVCLPNALKYAYFDKSQGACTSVCQSTKDVIRKCMYRMPDGRSKVLERFLHRPPSGPDGIQPNEVIASLSDCPAHFSIDEYKSFGMLPLGRHIIYPNILAQLAAPTVDFTKAETQTLLLQVIQQTGMQNGTPSRTSHASLTESSFGHAMLNQLEISLRRVAENWESWRAVATFVALAQRILSLTVFAKVRERSLDFLSEARHISMRWLKRLKDRANTSTDDSQRTELYSRATEIALMCSRTFDVEDDFIDTVLRHPSAISNLLECSIVIQENHGTVGSESQMIYNAMLQSWRTMLYRAFPRLRHHILQGDMGLHEAVLKNWAGFHPAAGVHWNILSEPHEHWLYIKSGPLSVYFDLLTAQLLVDGLPLARLPPEFMRHSVYLPLFGKSTLAVAPTDWPGMRFSAKSTYRDHTLHFGMEGPNMCVVAIKGNSM